VRIYKLYRPSPLIRARRLEKMLDTPGTFTIRMKAFPGGQPQPNTAIPQAFYNKSAAQSR